MHTSDINRSEVGIRIRKELARDLKKQAAARRHPRHRNLKLHHWLKSAFQHATAFVVLSTAFAFSAFLTASANLWKEV